MTRLHDLYEQQGQSPWLDNLKRSYLRDGELQRWVDQGVRGVTSNPTIFAKAIEGEDTYDDEFEKLIATVSVKDAYWTMVSDDVRSALAILRPTFDESRGGDGFVSIEVAPELAHDSHATITAARDLHTRIDSPNLFVKIPGTAEGVPAIRQMISEGRSINVTLIFSLQRYKEVIEAYISGLEALVASDSAGSGVPGLAATSSVASFFVSRVDTEVDRRLEAIGTSEASALRGKAAVAQAQIAYELFCAGFAGARWEALASRGARVQRPLWASTSTKNPTYPDLLYVDSLIGPQTINTMPDATLVAFLDHGNVTRSVDASGRAADAHRVLDAIAAVGVDMDDVAATLEAEGVSAFAKSFEEVLQALTDKANILADRPKASGEAKR